MTLVEAERRRRGWSRPRLAAELAKHMQASDKRAPISRSEIGRWERGEAQPQDYWLEKLCLVYGKSAEELGLFSQATPTPAGRAPVGQRRAADNTPATDNEFIVGRQAEKERFDALLNGQTPCRVFNIYGPGGIGKTVVRRVFADHATERTIPVASMDCGDPTLTPDRILSGLHQSLVEGSQAERIGPSLQSFGDQFNDFQTITETLAMGGGVDALFDVFGQVKDQSALAAVVARANGRLSSTAERLLHNRFALDRYLRNAERALTETFVQGIGAVVDTLGQPLALLLDTYEQLEDSPTESWVCRTFTRWLPAPVRLIILGRNALPRANVDWRENGEGVLLCPLPELKEEEAKAYLRHFGVTDQQRLDRIYAFTGGYPLVLMLVRYLAREAGGWDKIDLLEGSPDRDYVATQLLDRILREERVHELRLALERGAVARWLDPEALHHLLEVSAAEARAIYDKLQRHSFVERHPHGIRFHDKIRELLEQRLRFTDESEYLRLKTRMEAYHRGKSGSFAPPSTPEAAV